MSASDYLEAKVLDHVLRNTAYTPPTTVYMSLHTENPDEDGSGTELSGNGYSRQAITFAAASNGEIANSAAVEFTASGGNWDEATHYGIYDASTSGNLLFYGELSSPKTVEDNDTLTFDIGDITVTCD